MTRLHRVAVTAVALVIAGSLSAPAHANHVATVCDNGDIGFIVYRDSSIVAGQQLTISIGTGETHIRYGNNVVGVDTDPATVCVRGPIAGNRHFTVLTETRAGYVGAVIRIQECEYVGEPGHAGSFANCSFLLDRTGAFINTTAPLFSCIYVHGVQQNPGCP